MSAMQSRAAIDAYRVMPRERVLAMVRRALAAGRTDDALAGLSVHFDGDLLAEVLARGDYLDPEALGLLGASAVPLLEKSARSSDAQLRESRYEGLLFAMATAVRAGTDPPPSWDELVAWRSFGRATLSRWFDGTHAAAVTAILRAIPANRRHAVLMRGLRECPERAIAQLPLADDDAVIDDGIRLVVVAHERMTNLRPIAALGDRAITPLARHLSLAQGDRIFLERLQQALPRDAFTALTALAPAATKPETGREALDRLTAEAIRAKPRAKRIRIYVLARGSDGPAPLRRSRVGGMLRADAVKDIPRDEFGEPYRHLLSLDLDDVPELRKKYPRAAVLAFVCRQATGRPDDLDTATELPLASSEHLEGAVPLTVIGLDVPRVTFTSPASDKTGALTRLAAAIRRADGHVLGHPLWIQDGDDDDELLLQINDGLVPDLNLGDVGSLYFLAGGEIVFQCH